MAYIELKDVSYTYPDGTRALNNVSFSIEKGERIAVLGENGSGKSTLFLLLCGLIKARKGSCLFQGQAQPGLAFQNPDVQLFAPTVFQDVSYGPVNMGLGDEQIINIVEKSLEEAGIPELRDRPIQYLSYGQKKKASLAGILAMDREIMIMDEPMAWLDRKGKEEMSDILEKMSSMGKTLILSTHDPDFAWQWSDRILLFKGGELLAFGSAEEILLEKDLTDHAGVDEPSVVKTAKALGWSSPYPKNTEELISGIRSKEGMRI